MTEKPLSRSKPLSHSKSLGLLGENLACKHIESKGFSIIRRNFHCKFGEIDIIAEKFNTIYFFEVKTRTAFSMNTPEESISRQKIQRLIKSAMTFMQNSENLKFKAKTLRIMLIGILLSGRGWKYDQKYSSFPPQITLIPIL